jgi:hypothetical protein
MLQEFNNIQTNLQFTIETEQNNRINFLDITMQRTDKNMSYNIYRKPTTTDTVIHNTSCHPLQHKMTAFIYLVNRLNTYPIRDDHKNTEKYILQQNQYQKKDP